MDKQKQDRLISSLSGTLTTAVNAKLDKLIKVEMKNNILPGKSDSDHEGRLLCLMKFIFTSYSAVHVVSSSRPVWFYQP